MVFHGLLLNRPFWRFWDRADGFIWTDGTASDYEAWSDGEPNDWIGGGERMDWCVVLWCCFVWFNWFEIWTMIWHLFLLFCFLVVTIGRSKEAFIITCNVNQTKKKDTLQKKQSIIIKITTPYKWFRFGFYNADQIPIWIGKKKTQQHQSTTWLNPSIKEHNWQNNSIAINPSSFLSSSYSPS